MDRNRTEHVRVGKACDSQGPQWAQRVPEGLCQPFEVHGHRRKVDLNGHVGQTTARGAAQSVLSLGLSVYVLNTPVVLLGKFAPSLVTAGMAPPCPQQGGIPVHQRYQSHLGGWWNTGAT